MDSVDQTVPYSPSQCRATGGIIVNNRITGRLLNGEWGVGAAHALYSEDGTWYHHLTAFPGALFDAHGYVVFRTPNEYRSSPYLSHGKHVHITDGISSIPGYVKVAEPGGFDGSYDVYGEVVRSIREVELACRDRSLVARVKALHEDRCQICGLQLQAAKDKHYSEVHHIRPLGQQHRGPDVISNMLCVCPNHHVLLDLGAIKLEQSQLQTADGHWVANEYIVYYNAHIWMGSR